MTHLQFFITLSLIVAPIWLLLISLVDMIIAADCRHENKPSPRRRILRVLEITLLCWASSILIGFGCRLSELWSL